MNPEHPAGEPKLEPLARVVDMETYLFDHPDTTVISEEHGDTILAYYVEYHLGRRGKFVREQARAALWEEKLQNVHRSSPDDDMESDDLDESRPYS